jgi:hypothetical protein
MTAPDIAVLVKDIVVSVVPLLTIWIAYKTLRMAYDNISAPYRQKLYEKQMEGAVLVLEAAKALHDAAQVHIMRQPKLCLETDEARQQLRAVTAQPIQEFSKQRDKWFIYMPETFNDSLSHFSHILNAVSAFHPFAKQYPPELVNSKDPGLAVNEAYVGIIRAARKCIGTDPLSGAVLKSFGAPERPSIGPDGKAEPAPS